MILQGINDIFGGIKDKKQGREEFEKLQKVREDFMPRISTTAREDKINPFDKAMVERLNEGNLTADINKFSAASRNPLTAALMSSKDTDNVNNRGLNLLQFTDAKRQKARDAYKGEELSVMDKKFQDFLGREKRAVDLEQQGKERASGGLGAIDTGITAGVVSDMDTDALNKLKTILNLD